MTRDTAHRLLRRSIDAGDIAKPGRTPGLWLVTSDTHGAGVWWRIERGVCKCPAGRLGKPCRHKIRAAFEGQRIRKGETWSLEVLAAIGRSPVGVVDLAAERARRTPPASAA